MSTKSTIYHQEFGETGERHSTTVYLQSIPGGYFSRDDEQWFSLETVNVDYLQLPESKMIELVANLQQALSSATKKKSEDEAPPTT